MTGLPFFVDGSFHTFGYTVSHNMLSLRGFDRQTEVVFTGVRRMELDSRFTGGLTIAPTASRGDLDESAPIPLLLLTLTGSTFGSGFVACSAVQVGMAESTIFWEGATYSEHAVGGRPAEPGETAFGLPVLRRFAPEKRTTARFARPGSDVRAESAEQ